MSQRPIQWPGYAEIVKVGGGARYWNRRDLCKYFCQILANLHLVCCAIEVYVESAPSFSQSYAGMTLKDPKWALTPNTWERLIILELRQVCWKTNCWMPVFYLEDETTKFLH